MRVSIVGAGYVGLVTAVCLAEKGHHVLCVEIDEARVRKINDGISPIFEKDLDHLLSKNVGSRMHATTDLPASIRNSDITLICVATPFDGREIDLRYVSQATQQIGAALRDKCGYHAVVVKSTVVPGSTDGIVRPILEACSGKRIGADLGLGMNPEFLTEGQAVSDFMQPDRIVLGGADEQTRDMLAQLYAPFDDIPTIRTNNKTAEMIKYASNALLATQISFANEIANLCATVGGIDVVDVMQGVHLSYYLSPKGPDGSRLKSPISAFLEAGCGFGGSCLPKDVNALVAHAEKRDTAMPLLRAVLDINRDRPRAIIALLQKHFPTLEKVRISILGLSFKPDTDDMRDSPAIPIVELLLSEGAILKGFDPAAGPEARTRLSSSKILICDTLEEAIIGADALVLVTRWGQFEIVPELLSRLNPRALLVDGRRMLDKHSIPRYEGIGLRGES